MNHRGPSSKTWNLLEMLALQLPKLPGMDNFCRGYLFRDGGARIQGMTELCYIIADTFLLAHISCLLPALGCGQAPELIHSLEEESGNKNQGKNQGHFRRHFRK